MEKVIIIDVERQALASEWKGNWKEMVWRQGYRRK
jgi:hypothetical protein